MTNNTTPAGYYDRYDRDTKKWKKVLFSTGKALQSAELNEIQSIIQDEHAQVAKAIYDEGSIIEGLSFNIDLDALTVSVSKGKMYSSGFIHDIEADEVVITGVGTEAIGVKITPSVITELNDPDLADPAVGGENYGWAGAHRLSYSYQLTNNDASAVTIGVLIDGQLSQTFSQVRPVSDKVLKLLASRTYDESGSYTVFPFDISVHRLDSVTETALYDYKLRLKIDGGKAYVKGWKVENDVFTTIFSRTVKQLSGTSANAPDVLEIQDETINEADTYNATPSVYNLSYAPIDSIISIVAKVQTDDYSISRSNSDIDSLLKPGEYPLMTSIYSIDSVWKYVSGNSGPTVTYTVNVDYTKSGNNINWNTGGGTEPAVGETYYVKSTYTRQMVKAKRVLTAVTAESVTKGTDLSTETLNGGSGRECSAISKIYQGATEFSDYTVSLYDGKITWTGADKPANGSSYSVDYTYWNHTVEGDFVSRDSFVDSQNTPLLYISPTKTAINGNAIDYASQVSFETSSGIHPVADTDIVFTYNYVLPRIDLVSIDYKGYINIIKGVPSSTPTVPVGSSGSLSIASIYLPAEATPDTVKFTYFDNKTLTMTDLRSMLRTIKDMTYNDAVFQLHQDVIGKPLPTDKRGIMADNFKSLVMSDLGNANYDATVDILSGYCSLPQSQSMEVLVVDEESSTVVFRDDYWMLPYSHEVYIQQVYATNSVIVNEFSRVGLNSRVRTYPEVDRWTEQAKITTVTNIPGNNETVQELTVSGRGLPTFRFSGTLEFFRSLFRNGFNRAPVIPDLNSPLRRMQPESWWTEFARVVRLHQDPSRSMWWDPGHTLRLTETNTTSVDPGWTSIINNQVTTLLPYARECPVFVIGEEFVPGETVTCYFDGIKVPLSDSPHPETAQYSIPWETSPDNSSPTTPLPKLSKPCPVDSNGFVTITRHSTPLACTFSNGNVQVGAIGRFMAKFTIPPNTKAGTHEIRLVGTGGEGYDGTDVRTTFTSQGYRNTLYENITIKAPSRRVHQSINVTLYGDPLAQTFITSETSCYVTKLAVYFHVKPVKSVIVELRETIAGLPTNKVLGSAILGPDDCVQSSNATSATTFEFTTPVYLEAKTEYAFVVGTDDINAKLWVATLNEVDPIRGWVNTNPYTGVMLKSANASTWTPVQNSDIKFVLYKAAFADSAIIEFNPITVSQIGRFEMSSQCVEPGNDTHVRYQYAVPTNGVSTDGFYWRDFTPPKEVDLLSLTDSLKFRVVLLGTPDLSPIVYDNMSVGVLAWESPGNYIARMFKLAQNDLAGSLDVWLDTYEPAGTTITVKVCYDGTLVNYVTVPHISADDVRINENGWIEKHYSVDAGPSGLNLLGGHFPLIDTYTSLHIMVEMTSDNLAVTPYISAFRASANDLPA